MARRSKEIPVARTRVDEVAQDARQRCAHPQCGAPAEYRAPRSRHSLDDHIWFCLEHIQAYNRSWDYFKGMSPEEIERYRIEAVTGHRPTWKLGERGYELWLKGQVKDGMNLFEGAFEGENPRKGADKPLTAKQRKAFAEMELEATASLQDVKMRYKQLVKRFHPDANGGDKRAEERFKSITEAYSHLMSSGLF